MHNINNILYAIGFSAKADDLFGDADDISSDEEGESTKTKRGTGLEDDDDEEGGDLVIADKVLHALKLFMV